MKETSNKKIKKGRVVIKLIDRMCDLDIGNPTSILRAVQCIACAWKVVKSTTIVYCVYRSKDVLNCVLCKEAISSYEALDEELKMWDRKETKNTNSKIPRSSEKTKFKDITPRMTSTVADSDDDEEIHVVESVDKNTQSVVKFIEMSSSLVEDLFDLQDLYDKKIH